MPLPRGPHPAAPRSRAAPIQSARPLQISRTTAVGKAAMRCSHVSRTKGGPVMAPTDSNYRFPPWGSTLVLLIFAALTPSLGRAQNCFVSTDKLAIHDPPPNQN